jgi:hypothetical protein
MTAAPRAVQGTPGGTLLSAACTVVTSEGDGWSGAGASEALQPRRNTMRIDVLQGTRLNIFVASMRAPRSGRDDVEKRVEFCEGSDRPATAECTKRIASTLASGCEEVLGRLLGGPKNDFCEPSRQAEERKTGEFGGRGEIRIHSAFRVTEKPSAMRCRR